MSLTHSNPFNWRTNGPSPDMAGFLREMAAKSPPKAVNPGAVHQPPAFRKPKPIKVRPETKADKLRALLVEHGPMTSAELSALTRMPTKRIPQYLKYDIDHGRIELDLTVLPRRYALKAVPA